MILVSTTKSDGPFISSSSQQKLSVVILRDFTVDETSNGTEKYRSSAGLKHFWGRILSGMEEKISLNINTNNKQSYELYLFKLIASI